MNQKKSKGVVKVAATPTDRGVIEQYVITNSCGASVGLSTMGAGITSIVVPDAAGNMADVVVGYENITDYICDGPCAGKIPGRYANRIARGHFSLLGKDYELELNCGPNHLHGGSNGFQNHNWEVVETGPDSVTFALHSPNGDSGYPGAVDVRATYRWDDSCCLTLDIKAVTDAPTVVNLTNHTYFNLAGHDSGCALGHRLKLNASRYLETDDSLAPTGLMPQVAGTPMDFTTEHTVGRDINDDFIPLKYGKGYDHCWVVDGYDGVTETEVAVLTDPKSGRRVTISSNLPGAQVYSGNWLTGSPLGKGGYDYRDYDAVAIECQGLPDSPNHKQFPSTVLMPEEELSNTIRFRFSTVEGTGEQE